MKTKTGHSKRHFHALWILLNLIILTSCRIHKRAHPKPLNLDDYFKPKSITTIHHTKSHKIRGTDPNKKSQRKLTISMEEANNVPPKGDHLKISKVAQDEERLIKRGNVDFIDKNGDIVMHREHRHLMGMPPKRANDLKIHIGTAIGGLLSVKFPDVPAPVFIKQNPFYSFI